MRNRWFPARIADYVPATQMKQLKARDVDMARDFSYGVRVNLEEVEEDEEEYMKQPKRFVRPIEIDVLSVRCVLPIIHNNANQNSPSVPWDY
jgi:hypothetical protein